MIDREAYRADNCSVARTLEVVGERWTLLVLREAFYGVRRFDDFQRHLGVARNVLAARLAVLVAAGVLAREPYQEAGRRQRQEYRLTAAGRDLLPTVVALMQWGDRHLADPSGPPVELHHRDCGAVVRASLVCQSGHVDLDARQTETQVGPGALAA